jgi:beta-phosphoglucomutase-like phosphatase (HAD superfamily)
LRTPRTCLYLTRSQLHSGAKLKHASSQVAVVPPTLISKKASNWVDRGEQPYPTIERVLSRFVGQSPAERPTWFREQSETIVGMVAADASEVHVAGFLRTLLDVNSPPRDSDGVRAAAIAVWHIAKAALVRDFAERIFRGDVPSNDPTPDSLSHWLAARLLTPEQLAEFEDQARARPEQS